VLPKIYHLILFTIVIVNMFDFVSGAEELFSGNPSKFLSNVVYASATLALLAIIMFYIIGDSSYFKTWFYIFITFCVVLSMHYNGLIQNMDLKYKNNVDDLMDTHVETTDEIINASLN